MSIGDISTLARTCHADYKKVVCTQQYIQHTVMMLKPQQDIGMESHPGYDQTVLCVCGVGIVTIDGVKIPIGPTSCVAINSGATHNVTNTHSRDNLHLVVSYSPPKFPDNTVFRTKDDAERYDAQQQ